MFIRHRHDTLAVCKSADRVLLAMAPAPHMSTKASLLEKYRYRRRLPHLQKADSDLFITFCTAGRRILPEQARDLVLEHCLREGGILPMAGEGARPTPAPRIHLHTVVVMPDHVHLLLRPLRDEDGWPFPLLDILQCLKGTTAHRINRLLRTSGPVWEEESFDHVLRSDESLRAKCEYIRQNPVLPGLVRRCEDYRWLWVNPELNV
jgi:REP element-mobilizing transposase RayT